MKQCPFKQQTEKKVLVKTGTYLELTLGSHCPKEKKTLILQEFTVYITVDLDSIIFLSLLFCLLIDNTYIHIKIHTYTYIHIQL